MDRKAANPKQTRSTGFHEATLTNAGLDGAGACRAGGGNAALLAFHLSFRAGRGECGPAQANVPIDSICRD